jgi:hypothetical protein
MATQGEINSHDRLLRTLATTFSRGLTPLLVQVFDELSANPNPDRITIQGYFQPVRDWVREMRVDLETIATANREMNSAVIDPALTVNLEPALGETVARMTAAVDDEANRVMATLGLGAAVGVITVETIRQLRRSIPAIRRRLEIQYAMATRSFDAAVTLLRGRNTQKPLRYRYSGGIVAESRPFCRQHAGDVLTEAEIRRIWSSQTWAGKQPGDPFVVRGGYNCRHQWIPVEGE